MTPKVKAFIFNTHSQQMSKYNAFGKRTTAKRVPLLG